MSDSSHYNTPGKTVQHYENKQNCFRAAWFICIDVENNLYKECLNPHFQRQGDFMKYA